ncbi:MAG: polysaccharide deacetylase [Actinomycetia bacterium]|jgi:peptidoglycan/xylan/chitin deacetylase (PgdA/CDA1 family)|nr:polysaccharide deacetylase [Actinomycetes bacterium]
MGRTVRVALSGIAVGIAVQAAPAVAAIAPLRRSLMPGLAGAGDPRHVALTFDDGPGPDSTPQFLDVLDKYQVKATFFLLGMMLEAAPELGRELVAAGHEVAVHGWEHRPMPLRGHRATYDDLARARDLIAAATGETPRWYRPPYGVLSASALVAARRLGLTPILWTNWGRDWERGATPESVFTTVTRDLKGGATVLLHDCDCTSAPGSWRNTLGALPVLLDELHGRGLSVGPLREHGLSAHR